MAAESDARRRRAPHGIDHKSRLLVLTQDIENRPLCFGEREVLEREEVAPHCKSPKGLRDCVHACTGNRRSSLSLSRPGKELDYRLLTCSRHASSSSYSLACVAWVCSSNPLWLGARRVVLDPRQRLVDGAVEKIGEPDADIHRMGKDSVLIQQIGI